MSRVLLIEDDKTMRELIEDYLKNYDYEVKSHSKPLEAIEIIRKGEQFDIVILDLMLPQMDGFDVCKRLKEIKDIPIIISSARGDIGNKIMGYELGADDYLAKPYEPRELILKIEAILKRLNRRNAIKVGDLYVDEVNRVVKVGDYSVDFTKVEWEIFLYLIKNRFKVVSREQIINASSLKQNTKNRTVDMHISNIRYKIGDSIKSPKYIKSVWGIGYKFV